MNHKLVEEQINVIDEVCYKLYDIVGVNKFQLFSTCDKDLYDVVSLVIKAYYKDTLELVTPEYDTKVLKISKIEVEEDPRRTVDLAFENVLLLTDLTLLAGASQVNHDLKALHEIYKQINEKEVK